ncbi:hypothetical protein [Candidatus Mycoplasma mahonii]|uniref:hypothetical protein n=1 Tax=Candidatus Mycoplasma mahonii TaxID=3004105 RepID=UPI0026F1EA38|nr:hypothetical protein [Candidatus Mycoplasma mahonii]WKX02673.1 hypothetical protein O3I44_01175 [Candidatus Mycoplasma mahonii]
MKIENSKIIVQTNETKGEISSILFKGKEILHTTNIKWKKTFPMIWPVLGISKAWQINGKNYDLPKHGFWKDIMWEFYKENDSIAMSGLHMANDIYPFTIDIQQFISIHDNSIMIETEFANVSFETAYFHFGLHPAFKTDVNAELISDDKNNPFLITNKLTNEQINVNQKINKIPFGESFDTLIFRDVSTNRITLKNEDYDINITHDANNLQIWKPIDADFVCIEPWYGTGDEVLFEAKVENKLGIMKLKQGERWKSKMIIEIKEHNN